MFMIKGIPKLKPIDFFEEKVLQIKDFLRNYRSIKVRMILVCLMGKKVTVGILTSTNLSTTYFHSKTYINHENSDVNFILGDIIEDVLTALVHYQKDNGSGWYFKEVIRIEIHIADYKPMRGGSYISLPEFIKKKNAIINIRNKDDKCFIWSVLRYLHPVQKKWRKNKRLKKV